MTIQPQFKQKRNNRGSQDIRIQANAQLSAKSRVSSPILLAVAGVLVALLISGEMVSAAGQNAAANSPGSGSVQNVPNPTREADGAEILSDTRGVNFSPYIRNIVPAILKRYVDCLPEKARKPTSASGKTDIRFTINPDGKIAAMHLDASTHDDALNRAAWGAITGQTFPPLPAAFTGPNLEIRIHFLVNVPPKSSHS